MYYYINIGSNMGDRRQYIRKAVGMFWDFADHVWESEVMETAPWGYESERAFLNQGIVIETEWDAGELLAVTQEFERRISEGPHRNEDGSYCDRCIDIDLIRCYDEGEEVFFDSSFLTLPHPRAEEREFVIKPWEELLRQRVIRIEDGKVLLPFPTLKECIEDKAGEGHEWVGIRESWRQLGDKDWGRVAREAELEYWDRETRFCGRCGGKMKRTGRNSKQCPDCGAERFPRLSPAILVLVRRGEEALLVHAANFRKDMYALVAGFVETGESLEECVAREVMEETGMEVENIRYFGSQSWPFPAQMMVGFTADWKSGEPRWLDGELTSGGFFRRDSLPLLPTQPSLSRRLIDSWLAALR